jgi:2,4-dienoyl-CoA reductase-like NADH-dependent reductase (Old Yellow Enzyme family)/thioredoxin reductase
MNILRYKMLFEKGKIGRVTIRNRVAMTSMGNGLASCDGEASAELIRFYEDRARGGCGLIFTEFTRVDSTSGACNPNQLCIAERRHVRSMERLAQSVQRYGGKLFVQLHHGGREAPPALNAGQVPMAPSAVLNKVSGIVPREMTVEEIQAMEGKFINAAVNCMKAGVDGVELHAAHGYLLSEFVSPYTNKRTDLYGGSVENCCRIVTEILMGIKKACGTDYPVIVRMNGSDFVDGGIDLDYAVEVAKVLEAAGADALDVSCAVYESVPKMIEPNYFEAGWRKYLAKTVRQNVSIPVIAVNTITYPSSAEELLEEGVSDFVGVSRGQMADPEWVNKTKAGREDLIRKCMRCMNCNKSVVQDRYLSCAANPTTGYATLYNDETLIRNGEGRNVAIIGGGPAGMQAAIVLARRGFHAVLFEKNSELGGLAILAGKPPHKEMVNEFIKTLVAEMREYGVEVHLNTLATVQKLKELEPYAVVAANGGRQIVPKIPGVDGANVYGMAEVLMNQVDLSGKRVTVIGGGHVGLETAHYLAEHQSRVTVVEMMSVPGATMYPTVRNTLVNILKEDGVEILLNRAIAAIEENSITVRCMDSEKQETVSYETDAVVLAMGSKPDRDMEAELEANFERVVYAGDTVARGSIAEAVRTGNDYAWVL